MAEIAEMTTAADARTRSDRLSLPALVAATGISALGNGLTLLAVPWFVLITTGSAARTGLAGAMTALAMVVAGIFGGTIVDRLGFKRASIVSDLASGVTVALIPTLYFLDLLTFWLLLALVFLGAVLDVPGSSARRAMIPGVVRRSGSTLERANSALQFAQLSTMDFLAPLVAGVLIGVIGAASVLYVNTGTFALSLLIVAVAIPGTVRRHEDLESSDIQQEHSYFGELTAGMRYVATDPFLSKVIPISVAVNFLIAPLFVVGLPVLANETFESARALGLMAAGFGGGAAAGAILYGVFGHRIRRYTVYWGALAGGTLGIGILALATSLWMAVLATVIVGLSAGPINTAGMVIMQTRVPEKMMGRVFGLMTAASGFATPVGLVAGGFLIQGFGLRPTLVVGTLGVAACALWVRLDRTLRGLIDETEVDALASRTRGA